MSLKVDEVINNLREIVMRNFVTFDGRPIVLAEYQERFIREVLKREKRKFLLVASTRVGKTTAVGILAVLSAVLFDGEEVTIVSPTFNQSLNLFKTIRHYFLSNPLLRKMVRGEIGFRRDEINLKNGSVLRILTASSPEGLLGYGATVLIVDEAASIPDEVFRTRILRMLAGRAGRAEPYIILLSTPHSRNFFWEAYVSGRYEVFKVTWREGVKAGIMDKAWVEESKRMMSEEEFKVWFEAEFPSEGGDVFNMADVKSVAVESKWTGRREDYEYFMGLDIARLGNDESAIVIVAKPKGVEYHEAMLVMCAIYTRAKRPLSEIVKWAKEVAVKWDVAAIGVDITGMGAGVHDILKEVFGERVVGINMVGNQRTEVYVNLRRLIEDKRIRLINDQKFIGQFANFRLEQSKDGRWRIVKERYGRDDIVDALAYACWVATRFSGDKVYIFEEMMRL